MENITSELSVAEINKAGTDIIEQANNMFQSLQNVRTLINNSKQFFDSPAGQKVRTKFDQSAREFENFKNFLKSYGEFCQNFSRNMQSVEQAIQDTTDQIPNL